MSPPEHIALKLKEIGRPADAEALMSRPALEVADIFRGYGPAWRKANAGHVSLEQLKVMSAIESCRTAALGGHVARCEDCAYTTIAYNSCRNRHCPKCQGAAAKEWLAARGRPVAGAVLSHGVHAASADRRHHLPEQGRRLRSPVDPRHLGARIGITSVLHSWGSALTHHPHVHMIVPGGGISLDGQHWVSCRPGFFREANRIARTIRSGH
jgi:predicted Zn-ribbon and HTH transcriptional regulator